MNTSHVARFGALWGRTACIGILLFAISPVLAGGHTPRDAASHDSSKEKTPSDSAPKNDAGLVEVRFTDNSAMKMSLKDEKIEYTTAYGKLSIPVSDIRRIELAMRIPEDTSKKIDSAVATLGNSNYRVRQAASEELFNMKEKAYPALLKATKHSDLEVSTRAEEIITRIKGEVPEEQLDLRNHDIIYTDSSRIAGKIETAVLKVGTTQFGELQLKLSDVRIIRSLSGGDTEVDGKAVEAAPPTLVNYQANVGKTYLFKVTGATHGSLWGTDVYTADSTLAMAVVHAGILQVGQTGVVKVTIMAPPLNFVGSTRNGVTSSAYDRYPAAFRVQR
jgi:hypothetical protein